MLYKNDMPYFSAVMCAESGSVRMLEFTGLHDM